VDFQKDQELELQLKANLEAKRARYQSLKKEYDYWVAHARDLPGVPGDSNLAFAKLKLADAATMQAFDEYKTAVTEFNKFLFDRQGVRDTGVGGY